RTDLQRQQSDAGHLADPLLRHPARSLFVERGPLHRRRPDLDQQLAPHRGPPHRAAAHRAGHGAIQENALTESQPGPTPKRAPPPWLLVSLAWLGPAFLAG